MHFARAQPGLVQIMVRSKRLDWSLPTLAHPAEAAFALLMRDMDGDSNDPGATLGFDRLALALSRWSLAHGAAVLCLNGRLDAFAAKEGVDGDELIAAIALRLPPIA